MAAAKPSNSASSLPSHSSGKVSGLTEILKSKRAKPASNAKNGAKAKARRPAKKAKLPGSIYLNKNRYWWKVKLPGESRITARPLVPVGARYATKDPAVAQEVAANLLQQAIYSTDSPGRPADRSIMAIVQAYSAYARDYYRDVSGKPTSEVRRIEYATKPLVELFAALDGEEFGPLKLKQVRQRMIDLNLARKSINDRIACIKRLFRWAASEELVPAGTYQSILTVEGLKRGRSGAKETGRVAAVPESHVYAILPYTTPVVAAMIELQLLTGMRSTELCILRPCDIETSGKVWFYRPAFYKTQYLDREFEKVICLGPRCQNIIGPYLKRKITDYCFSPEESEGKRNGIEKNRPFNQRYDRRTYRKAAQYAITKAQKAGVKVGNKPVMMWTPHQLRHTATTRAAKEFGIEVAKAATGHAHISTTQIYAEKDFEAAKKVALRFG
ncbi:MAG: site-specific integrase [Planctomycetes bacterium]|nr:site-specific integrase [Planctomycetota bacterium]